MSSRNKKDFCPYCEQSNRDNNHIWCIDCGDEVEISEFDSKTCRCKECQIKFNNFTKAERNKKYYESHKIKTLASKLTIQN